MLRKLMVGICAAVFAGVVWAGPQFVIAHGKTANVTICVAKGASEVTKHAAADLAKYLGEMSGATFRVVTVKGSGKCIRVGEKYESEVEEEICLRVSKDGQVLDLMGEGERGAAYAVYTFLERLGCGFWTPTRVSVPKLKEVAVAANLNVVERPAFVVRQPASAAVGRHPDWALKLKVNGDMYVPPIPKELGGHRQYDISQCKLGLEDDAALFAAHPEYYALRGSGRSRQHVCNTNPGTRAEIVRRVRERLLREEGVRQIAIGLNDGAEFCECAACTKLRKEEGGQIGPELDLCNYVARQFTKSNPEVRFLVFAYESTLKPPKKMKCEANVDVCVAYIQRNYAREPAGTADHNAILGAWGKLTGDHVYVWGYNAQFKDFQMPWPIIDTLGPEMRTYRDLKVKGVYIQMANDEWAACQPLRCWLAAQLMWKPDQDEMKLMETWCEGACGKGGKYVFEWLKECKRAREATKWLGVYSSDSRLVLTAADILKGDALLRKAEAAVKDDAAALEVVKRIHNSITHVMLVRYNEDLAAAAKKAKVKIPSRGELLKTLVEAKPGFWNEGNIWRYTFLPRIRHGEVQLEKRGVLIPKVGEWTFRNPITRGLEEDPFVTYDSVGKVYYRVMTVGDELRIRRAKKMVELFEEKCAERVLWKVRKTDAVVANLRGPELVRGADGTWRVWACGEEKSGARRMFMLEGGKDPFAANSYRMMGVILANESASDPTVFKMPNGKWYLFYARESGQKEIVAREVSAHGKVGTVEGVVLGAKGGEKVPRSPTLVQMGKDVYLLYAAGDETIRALRYVGGDVMRGKAWEACEKPVIESGIAFKDIKQTFLTGPCAPAAFRSADGSEAWIAFRGWHRKDAVMCVQRLDDGISNDSLLFDTAAEMCILLHQPSGDAEGGQKGKNK